MGWEVENVVRLIVSRLWYVKNAPRSGHVLPCYPKNRLPLGDAMGWEVENVVRLRVPV